MAFRAAAVLSSLALASAFVAYRSGASAGSGRSTARPVSNPRSVTGSVFDDVPTDFLLEETQKDRRTFGGSKSGIMFVPVEEPAQEVMHSSKFAPMVRPADVKPAGSKPKPAARPAPQPAPQPEPEPK